MCPGNSPSQARIDYHTALAKGGGRALAHCTHFNLYAPTLAHAMMDHEIDEIAESFGTVVKLAAESGFDAVKVHAGHGYLISQFLSPHTNRRKDRWGGSFENRARFMVKVARIVRNAAPKNMAVLYKANMRDGFKGGLELDEGIETVRVREENGADAVALSGGFVSKAPMYVMRGAMPIKDLYRNMSGIFLKMSAAMFGKLMMPTVPFEEAYFLEDALEVRRAVKLPLVNAGGLVSKSRIEHVLGKGFDFVAMARALVREPDFVNKMKTSVECAQCEHTNRCIAVMYSKAMACLQERDLAGF